ncbi:hypothetical protein, partial [Thermoleptolyngbya sp.]
MLALSDRPSSPSAATSRRSPFISQHRHLSAIAPRHLSEPRTVDPNLALLNLCGSLRSTWDFSG